MEIFICRKEWMDMLIFIQILRQAENGLFNENFLRKLEMLFYTKIGKDESWFIHRSLKISWKLVFAMQLDNVATVENSRSYENI